MFPGVVSPAAPSSPAAVSWWKVSLPYAAACLLSLWLAGRSSSEVATLWFANPVGSVALMLSPWAAWPRLLAGLGVANGAANWGFAVAPALMAGHWPAMTGAWWSLVAFIPANLLEMAIAALALRRCKTDARTLSNPWMLGRSLLMGGVLPVVPSALAGAALLWLTQGGHWGSDTATWLSGSVIGAVVVLPLALAVGLGIAPGWRAAILPPRVLLIMSAALALEALTFATLPFPFVAVSLMLALLSLALGFMSMAVLTVLMGLLQALILREGVLLLPASTHWWGDSLFYLAVLESLLPGVLLSAALSGRETIIARLEDGRQRLRTLYVESPVMLHSVDTEGVLQQVSRHWLQTLGYREEEVIGRPLADFLTPPSADRLRAMVLPHSLQQGMVRHEPYEMRGRDGRVVEVLLSAVWERDAQGRPLRSLAVLEDVTERNRLAERSRMAEHDGLTGLPNRVLLQDRLEQACQLAARTGQTFAVGFIDLDEFKQVNDRHGHEAGDQLLREVGRRLRQTLREADTVSRYAGDEFVVVLQTPGDEAQFRFAAARLMQALTQQPCTVVVGDGAQLELPVAASLGLALYGQHGRDARTLLHMADEAMYRAKRTGRNEVALAHAA